MYSILIDQLNRQAWHAAVITGAAILSSTSHHDLARYCRRDPRAQLLFLDLLTRYPAKLHGAPVLIYSTQDMVLPTPELLPCPAAEAVAWVPLSVLDAPVFAPTSAPITVPANEPTCAVLVLKAEHDAEVDVPHDYWHDILPIHAYNHRVYISARMLLPWPAAVEAAAVLAGRPAMPGFASLSAITWAREAGAEFRASAASQF